MDCYKKHDKTQFLSRWLCLAMIVCAAGLSGCSSLQPTWTLQSEKSSVSYYTRESKVSSLPEFKASVDINAPMSDIITALTDFKSHPEWVYGCEQSEVLALSSLSEAYVYQVTRVPLLKDRDTIMHAQIKRSSGGNGYVINLTAAPDFCSDKTTTQCKQTLNNDYVRVEDAMGTFELTELDNQTTRVEWTQFLDPAGSLPHWAFRMRLSQVPIKSLSNLKKRVEVDTEFTQAKN